MKLYCSIDKMQILGTGSSVKMLLLLRLEGPFLHSVQLQRFPGTWSATLQA